MDYGCETLPRQWRPSSASRSRARLSSPAFAGKQGTYLEHSSGSDEAAIAFGQRRPSALPRSLRDRTQQFTLYIAVPINHSSPDSLYGVPRPSDTGSVRMVRHTSTALFLLLGAVAYLLSALVDSEAFRVVLQGIGSFLIAAVAIGYAYQYFLSDEIETRTVGKLDEVLEHRIDRVILGASRYGFAGFVKGAPRQTFDDLGVGDELLWLDTYSPDLPLFGSKLRQAVKAGASLRMLVIDPQASTARMRASEIVEPGYHSSKFCADTQGFLNYLAEAAEELAGEPGRIEVRCYGDLPCLPMYLHLRHGEPVTGTTGFFLSAPSFDEACIRWHNVRDGMLGGFCQYFEHKWAQQPTYTDSGSS